MSSGSITTSVVEEARVAPPRARANYSNLYKWPESDAEFMRSVSFRGPGNPRPEVVDSISCRQLYLKSYTFTRKESVNVRARKCIRRIVERVTSRRRKKKGDCGVRKRGIEKKVKVESCSALKAMFRKLFCCVRVNVMEASQATRA